jgi:hypothetical protein
VLGPCLIFGIGPFPELGVTGAAIGTSIGRGCGVLFQLYHLTRPGGRIRMRLKHMWLDPAVMRGILRISGTAVFQNFIGTRHGWAWCASSPDFGSAAVAGNTIGFASSCSPFCRRLAWRMRARRSWARTSAQANPIARKRRVEAGLYNTMVLGVVGWSSCSLRLN